MTTTPMRPVLPVAPVLSPAPLDWPSAASRDRGDALPLDLAALLRAFTSSFARADAEISRTAGGRVRMLLNDSSIEIETRWLRFREGRFDVLF